MSKKAFVPQSGESTVISSGAAPRASAVQALPPASVAEQRAGLTSGGSLLTPVTAKGKAAAERNRGVKENRVQVAVRLRPFTRADSNVTERCVQAEGDQGIKLFKPGEQPHEFYYDYVFSEGQEEVYDCIGKPMLADAFEGYNVTLFAYGQTGSGKTYSILGEKGNEGVIPRFCRALLGLAQEKLEQDPTLSVKIAMTFIEIYNEKVRDLLERKRPGQHELTTLEIHEDKDKKVFVDGISVHTILNIDRITQLLEFGMSQRQTSETDMNETSSRSHSVCQLHLSQSHDPPHPDLRDVESIINIVDLAGSERQSHTHAVGERFEEAKKINLSLLMLGRALNSFSEGKGPPPLRESKLTRILSESFGGNSRTWMLACISPSTYNFYETFSTLQYAQNAKNIVNNARVNAVAQKLELRQLKIQYSLLQELYDKEKEKSRQLQMELRDRSAQLNAASEEVEALRAQLEGRPPPRRTSGQPLFVGRTKLSLRNILQQASNYVTLPLISDNPDNDGALLIVNTFPVLDKDKPQFTYADAEEGLMELLGKRLDLVVHVIGAKNIPAAYSARVYCKYVFKFKERQSYQSEERKGQCDPEFDYKKRFAWSDLSREQAEYLMSGDVLTFEVIGHPLADGPGEGWTSPSAADTTASPPSVKAAVSAFSDSTPTPIPKATVQFSPTQPPPPPRH
eukprot:RCo009771